MDLSLYKTNIIIIISDAADFLTVTDNAIFGSDSTAKLMGTRIVVDNEITRLLFNVWLNDNYTLV